MLWLRRPAMTECHKSCRDSVKLTALTIAIALGFAIQAHVVRADDHKVACIQYLIETESPSTTAV